MAKTTKVIPLPDLKQPTLQLRNTTSSTVVLGAAEQLMSSDSWKKLAHIRHNARPKIDFRNLPRSIIGNEGLSRLTYKGNHIFELQFLEDPKRQTIVFRTRLL